MISIVGLGPGSIESLTVGALNQLKSGKRILLRTQKHPTVEYLDREKISYDTFDSVYDKGKSFDLVYDEIVTEIIKQHDKHQDIVYAVPGNPLVAESTVTKLIKQCRLNKIEYKIFPAVSFIESVMETMETDPIDGLKILDAFDIKNHVMDKRCALLITQVYDRFIASEVKLDLLKYYKDETDIYFIKAASVKGKETVRKIKLYQLDRQTDTDYLTSVYIPRDLNNRYDFRSLTDVIETLRGDNGCPWDREQTHESLKRCLIEESYEVIEAIDNKDEAALQEELGDLLLQVIMHAQIGKEEGYFDISDVVEGICIKMIERHPHVFGDIKLNTSGEVLVNWDKIKNKEQGNNTYTEELKHVAKSLPGLIRAEKIQKKAAKVGFDWNSVDMAIIKAEEEISEIKRAISGDDKENMKEEVGDLIFSAVNIARFLDIDPENAVNYTIEKFIKRFQFIETKAMESGKNLMDMSLKEMDELWEKAKIK